MPNLIHRTIAFSELLGNKSSPCFEHREYVLERLRDVFSKEYRWLKSVILHGSYATGVVTPFSDIDILMVTRAPFKELPTSEQHEFQTVHRCLTSVIHRLDPLMHHEVDVMSERVLSDYDESTLPLDTLRKSVLVRGEDHWELAVDRERSVRNAKRKLSEFCDAVTKDAGGFVDRGPYKRKCLMSVVFLIPVLLLQADKEMFFYKEDAIDKARELYDSEIDFSGFNAISDLRESWTVPPIVKLLRKSLVPLEPIIPSLLTLQRASGILPTMSDAEYRELRTNALNFVTSVQNYVNHNT